MPSGVRPTGIERCGRILAVRDRNSSILRDQSHSRLNSYVEVVSERTNNGAIPFPSPPWLRKDWPPLPPQNLSSIHTDRSSADDGSRVKPPRALQPLNGALPRKFAHSERFALPRMTAPAARNTIHHHGIRRNDAAYECERSCCRLHFVSSCEVVLHQDRKISLNLASR